MEAHLETMIDRWLDQLERQGLDKGIPVNPLGNRKARLTSDFAEREQPVSGASHYHPAYDFKPVGWEGKPLEPGTIPVHAAISGMVLFDGWYSSKSGRVVVIGGDNGRLQVYGHLDEGSPTLKSGTRMERGAPLGMMGKSGTVSATCLHYVERQLGVETDKAGHAIYDAVHDADGDPVMDSRTHRVKAQLRRDATGERWDNMRFREVAGQEIADFRKALGKPLRFDDFVAVAPTLGWNDQPLREGSVVEASTHEQLRHARLYRAAHPAGNDKKEVRMAHAPAVPEKTVWEKAMDVACEWTGLGCSAQAKPVMGASITVPIRTVHVEGSSRTR